MVFFHPEAVSRGEMGALVVNVGVCVTVPLECRFYIQLYTRACRNSPDVIGPQRYFQFSQDLGGLLNSPSEFLGRKIRGGS